MSALKPAVSRCSSCDQPLITIRDVEPWCGACEWHLDSYDTRHTKPVTGWARLDRRLFHAAYDLNTSLYRRLADRPIDRPGWGAARVATVAIALLLSGAALSLLLGGIWLATLGFPSPALLPASACILLAIALRPRFGRLSQRADRLTRSDAPTLFALIDQVATTIDAPVPHTVLVDRSFNAYATAIGIRRRRVLCLGLPLWAALPAGQRVALLGHELGHFVNGDTRRGLLTQPTFTTLATLADLVRPTRSAAAPGGLVEMVVAAATAMLLAVLHRVLLAGQILLLWIGLRDIQRAEYLADELSARAAGADAAADLADSLLVVDGIAIAVRSSARAAVAIRSRDTAPVMSLATRWRQAADAARETAAADLPARRQLSVRQQSSLFASHPPSGLRSSMIRTRPTGPAQVALTEPDSARIDTELARYYDRVRSDIAALG